MSPKRRKIERMVEGDVEASHCIAVETVRTVSKDGKEKTKKVKKHIYTEPSVSQESGPAPVYDESNFVGLDMPQSVADDESYVVKAKPTKVRALIND